MSRQQNHDAAAASVDALLDVHQAGEQLHCTSRMVRELVSRRELPVVRIGRLVRIAQDDLDAYKAACRRPASRGPLGGDVA